MITRSQAINAANAAAQGAYIVFEPKPVAKWWQVLIGRAPRHVEHLAEFVERQANAPAEALYRFGTGATYHRRPWGSDAGLQAACEAFHAALPRMLKMVTPPAAEQRTVKAGHFGKRTFDDRLPGMGDRVRLGGTAVMVRAEESKTAGRSATPPRKGRRRRK